MDTFSFSFGVLAQGFLVCESNEGIGTIICKESTTTLYHRHTTNYHSSSETQLLLKMIKMKANYNIKMHNINSQICFINYTKI